jgi:hypothetical protein
MSMNSWWQLGEGMGHSGSKMETWRLTCAFCGEKGNFALAFHEVKKKPNSDKRLNFDVYTCTNCAGFVHVLWSAGEFCPHLLSLGSSVTSPNAVSEKLPACRQTVIHLWNRLLQGTVVSLSDFAQLMAVNRCSGLYQTAV